MTARQYYESIRPGREAWRDSRPRCCMVCGHVGHQECESVHFAIEVHEIVTRARAPRSWGHRCNYLLVHPGCHQKIQGRPLAVQLAYKLRYDPDHYSLRHIRLVLKRGRGAVVVTEADVRREYEKIFGAKP